ncbi:hypothetical protein [Rhizobium sp. S163]|uniref:hypothetical protein n=1 Tax=Rhizobium sp. S163 TaxID=3055039 RepID=UPI0025A95AF7|nr:hypothetical protein [Rhizobium sp. S163]MDM9648692.1 hypothetical protein [Rhizobium sp. S163]
MSELSNHVVPAATSFAGRSSSTGDQARCAVLNASDFNQIKPDFQNCDQGALTIDYSLTIDEEIDNTRVTLMFSAMFSQRSLDGIVQYLSKHGDAFQLLAAEALRSALRRDP